MRALLRVGCGALVLAAKADEYTRWKRFCAEAGRERDLRRIGPGSNLKCDILNYELTRPEGSVVAAAQFLDTLLAVSSRQQARGDEAFWMYFGQRIIRHAISLVWLAKQRASVLDPHKVVTSAPNSLDEAQSEQWRKTSFCAECLLDAGAKSEVLSQTDLGFTAEFWLSEWAHLSETKPAR